MRYSRQGGHLFRLALLVLLGLCQPPVHAEEVSPAQLQELKEQIADIDQWLDDAETQRSQLERQLRETEQQISRLTRERRRLHQRISTQQQQLDKLRQQEKKLAANAESQRESLRKQIRAAWMEGDAPAVKVLLNEIDPDRIARTMTYYEYLSRDTVRRLEAFNANLRQLRETRQQAQATRVRLTGLEQEAAEHQQQLQASRKKREQTLAALQSEIRARKDQKATLEADRKRLERLLRDVEEAIAGIPSPNETQPFRSLQNQLPWPAPGSVSSDYGAAIAQGKLRQNGLVIRTDGEREVKAIHHGRVVFANWLRGFGLMTIIDHGGGYMSLYGHSSSLLTSPGDWVDAGEVIALSGRTGGTGQPGVYFEIRHQGKPQNPRRWLARR